jgi:peptidylprolyl isomerase
VLYQLSYPGEGSQTVRAGPLARSHGYGPNTMHQLSDARRIGATLLLVSATSLGLVACGSDSKSSSSTSPTASGPKVTVDNVTITNPRNLKVKPGISVADVLPPKTNVSRDLVVGTGPKVTTNEQLTARYSGVSWSTNTQFDSSWDRTPNSTTFPLVSGQVIAGWTKLLPGMRVGGRRLLIITPDDGYGSQGQGTTIAAGETLVFIVDAVKTAPVATTPSLGAASGSSTTTTN